MTDATRPPDPVSGGGWSVASSAPLHPYSELPPEEVRRSPPAAQRYVVGSRIGEGGMGIVDEVFDSRIGRKVARKRTRHPDVRLEARLTREIEVLGSLQHPGIVPLLDAGTDAAGRPWYTMPKLVGRTLKEELEHVARRGDASSLLRPMLAVCEAMAHAHDRGFVHRDLKPANVLLGDDGQVVVLDWGLARREDSSDGAEPLDEEETTSPGERQQAGGEELTELGTVMGTPRYMSPEQSQGEKIGKGSDVFALGVMLYQVGFGVALPIREGGIPDAAFSGPDAPAPAYLALLRKCLAFDPLDRYTDAGELARDLGRFVDGLRVQAHEYSTRELVQRFVSRHRLAISTFTLGSLVLAAMALVGVSRLQSESQARLEAELQARAALARADLRLHDSLAAQALTAARAGADPRAESLALGSLELGESPLARGVLAKVQSQSATLEEGAEIEPCTRAAFLPGSLSFACVRGGQLSVHNFEGPQPIMVSQDAHDPLILDSRHVLLESPGLVAEVQMGEPREVQQDGVLHGYTASAPRSGGRVWAIGDEHLMSWQAGRAPIEGPSTLIRRLCGSQGYLSGLSGGEFESNQIWGRCRNGWVFRVQMPSDPSVADGMVKAKERPTERSTSFAVGQGKSRGLVFLGTLDGEVLPLDALTLKSGPALMTGLGHIRQIVVEPEGTRLALRDDFGRVEIIDHRSAYTRMRLPGDGVREMAFDESGRLLLARDRLERWTLPDALVVQRREAPAGLASLAISHDDAYLAAAGGSGHVSLWGRGDPIARWHSRSEEEEQAQVVKDCAFAPRDYRLICVAVPGRPGLWRVPSPEPTPMTGPHNMYRRVAWLGEELTLLPYYGVAERFSDSKYLGGAPGLAGDWKDIGTAPAGDALVRINVTDGAIRTEQLDAAGVESSEVRVHRPGAVAVDLGPRGELAVAGPDSKLELLDSQNQTRWSVDPSSSGRLLDVEISHDGRLVAASTVRGEVLIWNQRGELRARIDGHTQRAVKLVFTSDDRALFSAGWDGSVRRWNMDPIQESASLPTSQWKVPLSEAIAAQGL